MDDTDTPADLDRPRFTISPAELEATRAKFDKINARAVRRGFTGRLVLDVQGPRTVSQTGESGLPVEIVVYDVTVTGEAPRYNGWRLLAALDWDPHAGLITRCAPGVDTIDRTNLRKEWCDHCETRRSRRKAYLVGDDDGSQMQVGSSCLKDFLGHHASVVFESEESVSEQLFGELMVGGREEAFSTDTVLGVAWACIKTFGWVPSSHHADIPTRDRVHAVLHPHTRADREMAAALSPLIAHLGDKAAEVRAFITSDDFSGASEYVVNLKAIIGADYVSPRNFGLLVSAPQAWARHHEQNLLRIAHREAAQNSKHVGAKGDKIERELTLTTIRYIPGTFGTTSLYTFTDVDGNIFKWFSSNDVLEDREGGTFTIRGTVKEHDEYRGAKQTVLTRCRILTVVDRLGKRLVTGNASVLGFTARDVLRRDPQSWTTASGPEDFVRVVDWLESALAVDGPLDMTQKVWNQYGEICGLHVAREDAGTVRVELRPLDPATEN